MEMRGERSGFRVKHLSPILVDGRPAEIQSLLDCERIFEGSVIAIDVYQDGGEDRVRIYLRESITSTIQILDWDLENRCQ